MPNPKQKVGKNINAALDGRQRVVIEGVMPQIDGGRYPIKRTVGEKIAVEADVFADGHDTLSCVLRYRPAGEPDWLEAPMQPLVNDRWQGEFTVAKVGRYHYTVSAWVDTFKSWRHELSRRVEVDDIAVALRVGVELLDKASKHAEDGDAQWLRSRARVLDSEQEIGYRLHLALAEDLAALMERYSDRQLAATYDQELAVVVEDERARFSSWYELFPRSYGTTPGQHGTFRDVIEQLSRIADMGFDVLYFPPIHPIGRVNRKGKNNTLTPTEDDVGSPWAIGSSEGGHKAIHPELGTLEDFHALVAKAKDYGIEIALDIAFQCAPDHPYVKEHPSWFRWRPDGTVQYAENPPKKYQDIYPFNFETDDWKALWQELKSIFDYWIAQGIRIFRVDNPHTKPFPMWEWIITEIKKDHPEALFLAEAFTRPKVMHRLAKLGYTQSYTYFTWRNTKWELTEYMTELTQGPGKEYFRPNFWPNTPDILPESLQYGGRPGYLVRLILAATMTANYGMYGPAFELMVSDPTKHGSEDYLDSEKYEIKHWGDLLERQDSLRELIGLVNRIRRRNPALQQNLNFCFHPISNEQLICYSKWTDDHSDIILVVVNLDTRHTQVGWVDLDLEVLGLDPQRAFEVHDLLGDQHYLWHGSRNYVELNPQSMPAHILRLHGRTRTERDFDYFLG
ncbi:MAG: alpha-1,4-glucan--maltose-1-phosphate maltosyltransferase [Candidatus Competibacteraceae bacterium]|nr:alpha-1,4-glucan--maltose-1-phosphate maltosyltransferase [Candidatus Competibacteraceae bacterium]